MWVTRYAVPCVKRKKRSAKVTLNETQYHVFQNETLTLPLNERARLLSGIAMDLPGFDHAVLVHVSGVGCDVLLAVPCFRLPEGSRFQKLGKCIPRENGERTPCHSATVSGL